MLVSMISTVPMTSNEISESQARLPRSIAATKTLPTINEPDVRAAVLTEVQSTFSFERWIRMRRPFLAGVIA